MLVNGLLLMSGQIGALCMSVGMTFLARSNPLWCLAVYGLLCLAAAVASCFMKEELKLQKATMALQAIKEQENTDKLLKNSP